MILESGLDGKYHADGIIYNEIDHPPFLYRAMELRWAILLRDEGAIRLRKLPYYKRSEEVERGDHYEGEYHETLKRGDRLIPLTASTTPSAFLFCAALPTLQPRELLKTFIDCECVVKLRNVHEFCLRINRAIAARHWRFTIICGKAIYDHGKIVNEPTRTYYSCYFQKHPKFKKQQEFRIALIDEDVRRFEPHNYYGTKISCDCPLIQNTDKYTKCPLDSSLCCECVLEGKVAPPLNGDQCPQIKISDKCNDCPLKADGYLDLTLGNCSDIIEILEL